MQYEDALADRDQIAFTTSLLGADQGSNREFARDCAKVLADLVSIMDRLRKAPPQDTSNHSAGGLPVQEPTVPRLQSPILNSHSPPATAWNTLPGDPSSPRTTEQAAASGMTSTLLPQERDAAYGELLAWLQHDTLQNTT